MPDTTTWDKPRDILEDMLEAGSALTAAWPHIDDRDVRQYWHREIDRAIKSLNALRQAACAGQDMERIRLRKEDEYWAAEERSR